MSLLDRLFRRAKLVPDTPAASDAPKSTPAVDPLDPIQRMKGWRRTGEDELPTFANMKLRQASEFPVYRGFASDRPTSAEDSAVAEDAAAPDGDATSCTPHLSATPSYGVPPALQAWYLSQSFIGYQACAIIAQHWLVDKACSMAGEDAARNGWVLKSRSGEDLDEEAQAKILKEDKRYKIKENLIELNRFKNIFGIRLAIFKIKNEDAEFYEKPFNIDSVTKDSYEGISQIDPYWMTPVLDGKSTSDPSTIGFYEPEFWQINGVKYHKSHLVIVRGPQPSDILKPMYVFGGIPLTQRIYERIYAAERTANEAPLLSMSKRTTVLHVDMDKVLLNQQEFEERLMTWIQYRDNQAVKVLGLEEAMEQSDISLADFDSVIMNQYQIVAAIARVPATKLLGTSPKGFNATGEFESVSYHEELESTQEHVLMPMLERHYEILCKSIGIDVEVEVVCNPVDSITTQQRAELNAKKSEMGERLINAGVISPEEERTRIKEDEHSGYNRLSDEITAEEEPGASPENLADMEKAENAGQPGPGSAMPGAENAEKDTVVPGASPVAMASLLPVLLRAMSNIPGSPDVNDPSVIGSALIAIAAALASQPKEGEGLPGNIWPPIRGTVGSTEQGTKPSTVGIHHVVEEVDTMDWRPTKLPKTKLHGMVMTIENPRGTVRKGGGVDGKQWSVKMPHHYGYINGTLGADGDEVDCMIGPNLRATDVFVINQKDLATGEFDEHKCMFGFNDKAEAVEAYKASYSRDADGFASVVPMTVDQFKSWLNDGDLQKPCGSLDAAMDEAKWDETKHPRAANGQFGSGGGGAAAKTPKAGTKSEKLINTAKSLHAELGTMPTPKEFHDKLMSMGIEMKAQQSVKYLKIYQKQGAEPKPSASAEPSAAAEPKPQPAKKTGTKSEALQNIAKQMHEANGKIPSPYQFQQAITAAGYEMKPEQSVKYLKIYAKSAQSKPPVTEPKAEAPAAQPQPQAQPTPQPAPEQQKSQPQNSEANITKVESSATSNGYNKEGVYNGGIHYYKDAAGKKVSYKPSTDSWVVIENGKITQSGAGAESFQAYVEANKGKKPEPGTMAASPVSVHHTATEKAKAYGDKTVSHESQSYASSGIANETALPSSVKNSILAYKGSSYTSINDAMRFNSSFDPHSVDSSTMAHILNLHRAFAMAAPSKKDVTVGRKVGLEALRTMAKDAGVADLEHLKPGDVLRDPGIVSTSHSANVWHGDVRFEIKIPKGSKAIDISETIKKNQSEQEVLLGPDSKLRIAGVKKGGEAGHYKYHITCELVQ